jgi:hypothetical protein
LVAAARCAAEVDEVVDDDPPPQAPSATAVPSANTAIAP